MTKGKPYNGYPSWNVCLWINNEAELYKSCSEVAELYKEKKLTKEEAICDLLRIVFWAFSGNTPDGARVSKRAVKTWLELNS